MEFDPLARNYVPGTDDGKLIGQHQSVHEDDTYQMGRLVERNLDAIRVNGGDPQDSAAGRLADANLGLICLHSGPHPLLRKL